MKPGKYDVQKSGGLKYEGVLRCCSQSTVSNTAQRIYVEQVDPPLPIPLPRAKSEVTPEWVKVSFLLILWTNLH